MASSSPLSKGSGLVIEDLLQLPRPSTSIVNPAGSIALWPSSTFSFAAARGHGRTEKSIYAIDLNSSGQVQGGEHPLDQPLVTSLAPPRKVLSALTFAEAAWLDDRTFLFLRPALPDGVEPVLSADGAREDHPVDLSDVEQGKRRREHAAAKGGEGVELWAKDVLEGEEYLVGRFPVV
jgi:hypothetical protein